MDKRIWIALVILSFALLIRISNVDKTIVFDEEVQTRAVMEHNAAGLDMGTQITPLTTWTRIAFCSIFGLNTVTLKLVSVLFGMLTILLVYFLAKELYSERTAMWTILIMSLSAWYVLGTTSISFDASFLTFYYVLTIFFFVKYLNVNARANATPGNEGNSPKLSHLNYWLYLTGISFGLAMLTKLNAILIIPILLAYRLVRLYDERKEKRRDTGDERQNKRVSPAAVLLIKIIKDFSIIGLIGAIVFSVFPITAYLTDWHYFTVVMHHTSVFSNPSFNLSLLLIQYVLAFIWMGPLLIGLYLVKLATWDKKDKLMHIWIAVVFLFFTFIIQENFRPLERYFFAMLPPLSVLAGDYLAKFRFNKKHLIFFAFVTCAFLASFFILNINNTTLAFYPKTEFINHALSFQWNFDVPFTGDQGPIGMNVAFSTIIWTFICAGILCTLMLFLELSKRKDRHASNTLLTYALLLFLAVTFAFNTFMLQELIFSTTHPNLDKINKDVIAYADANTINLKEPIFVFRNNAFRYYLAPNHTGIIMLDFRDENNITTLSNVQKGGTVIIIDFPSINKDSALWQGMTGADCELKKGFSDKGHTLGYIFDCGNKKNNTSQVPVSSIP